METGLGQRALIISPLSREAAFLINNWILVFSAFFFFPGASTAVFQTFNVDRGFDDGDCWLRADYSLSCRDVSPPTGSIR